MKISVVIIAHNEEQTIAQCIHSILDQTVQAHEIIVVVHNSTDQTLEIAQSISDQRITVDEYQGPATIVAARIRGITQTTGDIILCIDGDAWAEKNWIEVMSSKLEDTTISLGGSSVVFFGTLFWKISTPLNKLLGLIIPNKTGWIWGPSFAFRSEYKQSVLNFLEESQIIATTLELTRNPDDYWLALNMQTLGQVIYTTKTKVFAKSKQLTSRECLERHRSDVANGKKLLKYFKTTHKSY